MVRSSRVWWMVVAPIAAVSLVVVLAGCGGSAASPDADVVSAPDAAGGDAATPDAGTPGEPDAAPQSGDLVAQLGLFVNNPDRTGPIMWIPVDDTGLGARVEVAAEIPAGTRRSTWGYYADGAWLFYTVGDDPDQGMWARHLDEPPQRLDDGSSPYWGGLTQTGDKVFFVGESEIAWVVELGDDGSVTDPVRVSRDGKRVFSVPPAPSGRFVAMHYYGFQIPIVRVVQDIDALGTDLHECCGYGYYWNLSPKWANHDDRELMVAGPAYENRDLYVIGIDDPAPTPVHLAAEHGGRYVVDGNWSADDELIAYSVKMTVENFSNHLHIADVRGAPQRIEVTDAHTAGVYWRPGTNSRHVTYNEYPSYQSQQRLMLGTVTTDPLGFTAVPLVEHDPSDNFGILYEWNVDGTALLHHGGADGEYTVTFVSPAGAAEHVPLGIHFLEQDAVGDWSIPHLSWSEDGRWIICRTNTGYSIAHVDVTDSTVGPLIPLPPDVDFAWFDLRLVRVP